MGLLANGFRDNCGVFKTWGLGVSNGVYPVTLPSNWHLTGAQRNLTAGEGISEDKVGVPLGNLHPNAWIMPQKAGYISARSSAISISATGAALAGFPIVASSSISITVADAAGQLIVSGTGSTSFSITTNTPLLTASILGTASSTIAISTNNPILGAIASLIASSSISMSASMTPYAIGHMEGAAVPYTELSPQSLAAAVWEALASEYNDSGTMGEKVNDAGSASNPWTEVIEGSFTASEMLRIIASALAGETSGFDTNAPVFKGLDGATDRITGTLDEYGNRSSVTLDGE